MIYYITIILMLFNSHITSILRDKRLVMNFVTIILMLVELRVSNSLHMRGRLKYLLGLLLFGFCVMSVLAAHNIVLLSNITMIVMVYVILHVLRELLHCMGDIYNGKL